MKISKTKLGIELANKCMTVTMLSKTTGVSKPAIYSMMNGSNARFDTVGKIAKALEVPVKSIIAED